MNPRELFIALGLIRPQSAIEGRPLSADELDTIGYPMAARAKRQREWFA